MLTLSGSLTNIPTRQINSMSGEELCRHMENGYVEYLSCYNFLPCFYLTIKSSDGNNSIFNAKSSIHLNTIDTNVIECKKLAKLLSSNDKTISIQGQYWVVVNYNYSHRHTLRGLAESARVYTILCWLHFAAPTNSFNHEIIHNYYSLLVYV